MNMPGFTAELSLASAGHHYGQSATRSMVVSGAIQPARATDTLAFCQATCPDGTCRYVCGFGCRWVCMKRLKGPIVRRFENSLSAV